METSHPFYPLGVELVGYVANDWKMESIFAVFGSALLALYATTRVLNQYMNPRLPSRDQALVVWFVLSGSIHLFIEGYFSINHRRMPAMTDYLGQGWKEYAKCDSRYMTGDPFVVCMESVTAWAWGPLCLLTSWMILRNSPWRHAVQLLVSSGQFYGDFLYFTTNLMDEAYKGIKYSRPDALYYWGYFVGMNTIWIVIPAYCVYSSMAEIATAFSIAQRSGHKSSAITNATSGKLR